MNPALNAFLSNVRILLVILGGLMVELGIDHLPEYKWIMIAAGSITVLGNAVWAAWSSFMNWRKAAAVGVAAGINLTVQGKALAADGVSVVSANDGSTPPLPVTIATAAEIVKEFAPDAYPAKA